MYIRFHNIIKWLRLYFKLQSYSESCRCHVTADICAYFNSSGSITMIPSCFDIFHERTTIATCLFQIPTLKRTPGLWRCQCMLNMTGIEFVLEFGLRWLDRENLDILGAIGSEFGSDRGRMKEISSTKTKERKKIKRKGVKMSSSGSGRGHIYLYNRQVDIFTI